MNTNNSNKEGLPLWKRLNEERTQGEWEMGRIRSFEIEGGYNEAIPIETINTQDIAEFYGDDDECKANAQYTALAVNNLHHLAEALEMMVQYFRDIEEIEEYCEPIKKAKEALSRIS